MEEQEVLYEINTVLVAWHLHSVLLRFYLFSEHVARVPLLGQSLFSSLPIEYFHRGSGTSYAKLEIKITSS